MTTDSVKFNWNSFLTVQEVAALLRVDASAVRRWIRKGELKSVQFGNGRTVRVPAEELRRMSVREAV
jgi:excisionase family DNA binding protein